MKKVISILFSLALFFSVGTHVFAADNQGNVQKIYKEAQQTDNKIEKMISKAQFKADKISKKNESTAQYTADLNTIISDLQQETSQLSQNMIQEAAEVGVTLTSFSEQVQIGNQLVWVDPIKVVGVYE